MVLVPPTDSSGKVTREPLFIGLPTSWNMRYSQHGVQYVTFDVEFNSQREADKFRDFVMANVFLVNRPPRMVEY